MDKVASSLIREMEPSLTKTPHGWLALSPRTAPINIGVVGESRESATKRFRESATAWARLHDLPEPEWADATSA